MNVLYHLQSFIPTNTMNSNGKETRQTTHKRAIEYSLFSLNKHLFSLSYSLFQNSNPIFAKNSTAT